MVGTAICVRWVARAGKGWVGVMAAAGAPWRKPVRPAVTGLLTCLAATPRSVPPCCFAFVCTVCYSCVHPPIHQPPTRPPARPPAAHPATRPPARPPTVAKQLVKHRLHHVQLAAPRARVQQRRGRQRVGLHPQLGHLRQLLHRLPRPVLPPQCLDAPRHLRPHLVLCLRSFKVGEKE